jgi:nucleotide-binding universal stress UspA family protein
MSEALRVLVPVDGSEPARRATLHVLHLAARGLSVEVHLLNVRPAVRGVAASLVSSDDLEDYHRDEGMKALAESMQIVEAAGLKPHAHVCVGDSSEMILAFARRLNSDQIVMGTRGLGPVTELLLGSVARQVVGGAPVPVTLVR